MAVVGVAKLSLKDLRIEEDYRSDRCDLVREFYLPCLEKATLYQRAVGFFSSSSMALVAQGLTALIRASGKMQLIASPQLSAEDIEAIASGIKQRKDIINQVLCQELEQEFTEIISDRLGYLAWLLAHGFLEIKIAVVKNIRQQGIYHEKLGIFRDTEQNLIAFTGSANESSAALMDNFECIDVYCSWQSSDQKRALRKAENFQHLWNNTTENVEVIEFPEAARRSLLRFCPAQKPEWEPELKKQPKSAMVSEIKGSYKVSSSKNTDFMKQDEILTLPTEIFLRQHQTQAIREWFAASGKGIFEMATGSGKTITSLAAATILYKQIGSPLLIVIVCPYLHLLNQWVYTAKRFGLDPLPCAVSRTQWESSLSVRIYNSNTGLRSLSSIITTNATFASEAFQHQIKKASRRFLLIVDEVHNLGAEQLRKSLPPNASYRLGLSATPERWFDKQGSEALTDYFGSTLAHYTLAQALKDKVLCRYRYYPQLTQMTHDEFDRYYELTVKIARILGNNNDAMDQNLVGLEALLIQRSRLIATAQDKLDVLRSIFKPLQDSTHNLIYCGDGSVETELEVSVQRQIDAVTSLLGHELGMRVAKYTAETPISRREELHEQFARGEIQCLVAIRCLDEGVDIPETRRAFILASSSNPRQFIQRRGRLLRTSPGKQMAEIFDFIVQPPNELTHPRSEYYGLTRDLFAKELKRVIEFAKLAVNKVEALGHLLDLRDRLNLLDLGVDE